TLSPDLTRPAAGPQPPLGGGPADFEKVAGCGVIYTIAPSPRDADEIWAGTDDGFIQLTRDGGKTWKNVTPPSLGPWSMVSLMDASHFDAGSAYAAIDRHQLDDYRPYIVRTHDYGGTWKEVTAGIPDGCYVHVVREDPGRKGLLYAGTERGVFVSFDDGDHWQSLQLNLPGAPVHDLVVHGDDLVAATHGRSFWILDDITALRELNAQVTGSEAYLFKPAVAIRLRPRVFDGTPLPPEEPAGQNPPMGAVIDYELQPEPSGDVRLEILSAQGKPIRQFSSADKPAEPPRAPVVTAHWLQHPAVLTKQAGMNRFVWDLRYPPPPLSGRSDSFSPRGLMVLPGDYQARLTMNGHGYVQPFKVELDPRVKTSRADLERQFTFEQQVIGALTNARNLNIAVRDLNTKLGAAGKSLEAKPETADIAQQVRALIRKVGPLIGERGAEAAADAASSSLDVPRISSLLTQTFAAADGADAAPTDACVAAAHKAQEMLAGARAAWGAIKKQDVPKLNDLLRQRSLEQVEVLDDL
ncbi:MAG TPA: sialidase family protein, partial [Terriglobia bacterium]